NKNKISDKYQAKLKDAELKFVVAGSHSFNSLENNGILELLQVRIEIGGHYGLMDVHDVFYGRKTIREQLLLKFDTYIKSIRSVLNEPIKEHCLAATCDLWTDDMVKRIFESSTLQNMVPSYYKMAHSCRIEKNAPQQKLIINALKSEIIKALGDKYWPSITTLHWIAIYLEPTFKHLAFVNDKKDSEMRINEIRKGLHVLVNDTLKMNDDDPEVLTSSSSFVVNSPPCKRRKDYPFADIRQQQMITSPILSSSNGITRAMKTELDRQIQFYESMTMIPASEYDHNPLSFWKEQQDNLTMLARIAKSVLVIQ
ncbi:unnamed protein product, partial [Didymodactylos carnosus]